MRHTKQNRFLRARLRLLTAQWGKARWSKSPWLKGLCGLLIPLGIMAQLSHHVALVYSHTGSLPYRFFLQMKKVQPLRGQYTQFYSPWHGKNVIKKVVGKEGDAVSYDPSGSVEVMVLAHHTMWLGRQFKIGKPQKQSKDGRPLTPIKPGTIPKGMVFVSGDHERSFDSRYQEMGLVREQDLQGRLIALI